MKQKDLIEVEEGKFIIKKLLERWTPIALECYKRNCDCNNCDIIPPNSFHEECNIKYYVRGYFLMGILPQTSKKYNRIIT